MAICNSSRARCDPRHRWTPPPTANSALKGAFVDLARGFFRVMGQVKMSVLLGFTLAAYNIDRVRSFRAKQAKLAEQPRPRAKRRQGTWADLGIAPVDSDSARSGDPPG